MKIPSSLILGTGLVLWIGATAGATYYSNREYNELWSEKSIHAAYKADTHIQSYKTLMSGFYSMMDSSSASEKADMDRFFENWKNENSVDENYRDVVAYGIYCTGINAAKSFYTPIGRTLSAPVKFRDVKVLPEANAEFATTFSVDYLELPDTEKDVFFYITKQVHVHKEEPSPDYIFVIFDRIHLKHELEALVKEGESGLSAMVLTDTATETGFINEVYRHKIPFGSKTLEISFEPKQAWTFWGKHNRLGIIFGIIGFCLYMILFYHIRGIQKQTDSSLRALNKAERKLAEQATFMEELLENLPGILFVKDARHNFQYYMLNREAERFFGHSRAEMIGKVDDDFFSEEEAKFFHAMDDAAMMGRKVIDIPCELVTTPSGEALVHTRKFPIYDQAGNPMFLVGLAQDITKRKKNELELAEYRENLERMVEERTEKLKLAMGKAEEASRLKSEFLATMSHEIRSPMSGVLGMAELLMDTPLTLEQKGLTKTILSSGEVLMNIIEDILDFSKIEANKLELDPVAVNMLELVDDVCMLYSSRARDKALEIVVRYVPGSEQFVYADSVRVRQVLGNLLNNAIKFTQKGYITITVSENKSADLPADKVNLIFSVEDTGIGIAPADQERIFEKFSQANSSTTRDYGGTGLGLSICRKLIELMGGKISLKSEPGQGSTFSFFLPMSRNTQEHFVQPLPPVLKGCRVLVVDDLPVIRLLLQEQLYMAGMACDIAANGHQALQKLVEAQENDTLYDMIIIDYLMPEMNGEMLARAINDEPAFRNICLVMLTAAGNPIVGDDFIEKGFSAYISKPVRYSALIESLAIIWERYQKGYTNTLIRVDSASLGALRTADEDIRLEGSRILLVEDSRLNQAFAEEVLTQLACDTTTVSNGQEALNALAKDTFDLVLMDCQMPVMDGFEASRHIRTMKAEGRIPKNMPVLALTANAMKDDRQRCLDAGMDDYITKPVRKKELKEKIFFWIKKEHITADDSEDTNGHPASDTSAEILNIALLHEARSLLKDKFDFLLGCYIEDVETYIREMQAAASSKNLEGIVRPAHTIKSTSKRMGALCLSDIAKDIEAAARDAANCNTDQAWESSTILQDIHRITEVFEETKKSLKEAAAA